MSEEPVLRARRLTRTFGQGATLSTAVNDVSLQFFAGQTTVLMGPSGSGKSTLLAILGGLLPPTSGQVTVLGQDLWQMSELARHRFRLEHCGFIFQGFNLFAALTARQQLEMVLGLGKNLAAAPARQRAEEMLTLLGLEDKMHLRPAELSGGEKQRVAIARALIKEPTFCFADEPTGALDWGHGKQVVELLCATANRQKTTLVIVTHDVRILPYVHQVHYLEDGCLKEKPMDPASC